MHNSCYIHVSLSNKSKRLQAEQRLCKSEQSLQDRADISDHRNDPTLEASACKKLHSSMGCLHDKTRCVWCMKGVDPKNNSCDKQLLLLSTKDAWSKLKLHTVRLEDEAMRHRLDTLITFIPDAQTA